MNGEVLTASPLARRIQIWCLRRLRAAAAAVASAPPARTTTVVNVRAIDAATERAVWYARSACGPFQAVHVPIRGDDTGVNARWHRTNGNDQFLERLPTEGGSVNAVLEYVWGFPRGESDFVNVVVPEFFHRPSLLEALRNRTAFSLKLRLLQEPGVVVTDVPLVEGEQAKGSRLVGVILVSGVHGASLRAVNYARSLQLEETRAVFFAFDAEEARRIRAEWQRREVDIPLDIVEAQFRDLGEPLLAYLHELTADGETVVNVIMPELVVRGWRRLLHNQRALYVKRILLFEPRVILSSVPYQLT